jgi:uncharacterized protein
VATSSSSMTRFETIGPESADEALEFCAENVEQAIYIAGWIHDGGLGHNPQVPKGWVLAERDRTGEMVGLCYLSATGILMPVIESASSIEHLFAVARANPGLIRVIVGERTIVAALWERIGGLGLLARIVRDQVVYTVHRDNFRPAESLPLIPADKAHLDQLVAASAAMAREEAQDDPQARNPTLFRDRIRARMVRGRDFIYLENDVLVFKGNVSALCHLGGQVEGIYTMPERRRHGFGKRGTSFVTSWVLERAPSAILLVNEDNTPARKMYESLGYEQSYRSRTIFVAP